MFETILVPGDGSESSWQAMAQGIEIARLEGDKAVLHGLYVVDDALIAGPFQSLVGEAMEVEAALGKEGRAILTEFGERAAAAGVHGDTQLVQGDVARLICERAGLADLVVLGRRGAGGMTATLLFGSTFEAMVRYSPRPVLVAVPPARPVRRVLAAYDGSERAKDALGVAAQAAQAWGAAVTVLSVSEAGRVAPETLAEAAAYLREHQVEPSLLMLPEEHPAAAILRVAEQRDIDLIVLGGYGHGRFLEMLFGHAANEVMRHTTRPLLICR